MDGLDHELLISCTAGLGCWMEDNAGNSVYCKTDDCVECLKDLQRFLRQDAEIERPAFFALCNTNVAKTDLVPLLAAYPDNHDIVYNAVKVATFLTLPQREGVQSHDPDKQIDCMQAVMEAFLAHDSLSVVISLLTEPLSKSGSMSEDDAQMVQLIMVFFRNLLKIPDRHKTAGSRGDHKSKLKSHLMTCMFDNHIMELILLVSQHASQGRLKAHAPLLLEVLSMVFCGVDARQVLLAKPPSNNLGTNSRTAKLATTLPDAKKTLGGALLKLAINKAPPRHPRFGGVFASGSATNQINIQRNAPEKQELPELSLNKARTKQMRKAMEAEKGSKQLEYVLVTRIKDFLDQFLASSYGVLMTTVGKLLEPGLHISKLPRSDFIAFIEMTTLCTTYVRLREEEHLRTRREKGKSEKAEKAQESAASPFACISATLSWETFQMVQSLWVQAFNMRAKDDKKDWKIQQSSLILLKELLLTLDLAKHAGTSNDRIAAASIAKRLLQNDQQGSGLLIMLALALKEFNFQVQPRSHAVVGVEAVHVTLRLLEQLSKQEGESFRVLQDGKRKAKPKPAPKKPSDSSVGLNGSPGGSQDSNGGQGGTGQTGAREDGDQSGNEAEEADIYGGRESTLEEEMASTKEVVYNLNQRIRQLLALPAIVHLYTWLLQGYKTNGRFLNHAICSFLRRISASDALDMESMLYQLSILRVFEKILADKQFRQNPHAKELIQFCTQVTRNMFSRLLGDLPDSNKAADGKHVFDPNEIIEVDEEVVEGPEKEEVMSPRSQRRKQKLEKAAQNVASMLFVELLFWKPEKVCNQIATGYDYKMKLGVQEYNGSLDEEQQGGLRAPHERAGISLMQEAELRELWELHGMDGNYLELLTTNWRAGFGEARVKRALKALGLKKGLLTSRQEAKLRELYEEHKDDRSCARIIAADMPGNWMHSQISRHIKQLGLREAPKKKGKQHNGTHSGTESGNESDEPHRDDDAAPDGGNEGATDAAKQKKEMKLKSRHISRNTRGMADWSDDEDNSGTDQDDAQHESGSELARSHEHEAANTASEGFAAARLSDSRHEDCSEQDQESPKTGIENNMQTRSDNDVGCAPQSGGGRASASPISQGGGIEIELDDGMEEPPENGTPSRNAREQAGEDEAKGNEDVEARDESALEDNVSPESFRSEDETTAQDLQGGENASEIQSGKRSISKGSEQGQEDAQHAHATKRKRLLKKVSAVEMDDMGDLADV